MHEPAHLRAISRDALFSASPNPYVVLDRAFTIVWMNEAYLRVTGRSREEIIDRNMFDAFPGDPASEAQLTASLNRAIHSRERDHLPIIKYDIAAADGTVDERFWSATHTPLLDKAGEVTLILQHTVDITELHRLRAAASAAETTFSSQVEGAIFQHARNVEDRSRVVAAERDQLRHLFEQAPGFMAMLQGPRHVFTLANAAYVNLVGRDDLLGRPLAEALPEVSGQGFVDILDRIFETGEPYVGRSVPVILRATPDGVGEERIVDFVYQPIRGSDGAVSGIFVQGHDLTDKARAEKALQESEERFRLVAESAPVMLWMSDAVGHCAYLNEALRRFWAVELDALDGFDWTSTVHPEDWPRLQQDFMTASESRTGFTVEARYLRADGEYRILHTTAHPRFGLAGEIAGMIGVNVDVTEIRHAEAALLEETRSLEILNQTTMNLAAELDLGRVVQKVTDAGVELTGAAFGAFFYNVMADDGGSYMLYSLSGVERSVFEGYPMPRATKVFEPTFNGTAVVRSDDILLDPRYGENTPNRGMPTGHLPVRSYLAVPVRSRSGSVLGGLFFGHQEPRVFSDRAERLAVGLAAQAAVAIDNAHLFQAAEREIAQRKDAERALQDLNTRLENEVAARTEELRRNEEALRHAQKMEALGRLTGGIAHDFNNLLQVISGNLHLLSKDAGDEPRMMQRLQSALSGVNKGATLASQLLAFGRRQPLAPKVVDLGRLVRGLDDMLRRALGENIEVEMIAAEGIGRAFVDPVQVENAVLNLAINARDAMEGRGRLTVELRRVALDAGGAALHEVEPGPYLIIAVSDTGCGMTPEVIERAFDPFFTTKPEGQGTGLGLSQVYGFVRQSSGTVEIESIVGEGTTMRIYLPAVEAPEEEERPAHAPLAEGGTETILVVEDDERVRATVVEMLADLGYSVLEAASADAALALVDAGGIDLLFTDVVMPGEVHSTDLARIATERLPDVRVLFTSGYTRSALDHDGHLAAGVELLSKPYSREQLARRVREVLDARPPHPAAAAGERPEPRRERLGILLVEDDPFISMSTADMLAELGHEVMEAATGAEARTLLTRHTFDVLVTDIGLPDMSGLDLAAEACRDLPHIRVVFASGRQIEPGEVARDCLGRFAILVKPYDEAGLEEALAAEAAVPAR